MLAVVPVRWGPNPELRYAMRSWAQHVPQIEDVLLVGAPGSWVRAPVVRTPQHGGKAAATTRALRFLLARGYLPEQFVLMNDDFFALRPTMIPNWHRGLMLDQVEANEAAGLDSPYTRGMAATMNVLRSMGVSAPLCYEVHAPMVVRRDVMRLALDEVAPRLAGQVMLKRSVYGNLAGVGGQVVGDVKLRTPVEFGAHPGLGGLEWTGVLPEVDWVSTSDRLWTRGAGHAIAERFVHPSPWEHTRTGRMYAVLPARGAHVPYAATPRAWPV